jgi:purine nucleosidase
MSPAFANMDNQTMTDNRIPLLIDTDPGVDDALALLMALRDPRHDVRGLTIAAGNVGLRQTVANALKLCEVAGRGDVPVFPGCDRPLLHAAPDAAYVHGNDGFGDTAYTPATRAAATEHAVQAILRLSHEHAGRLLLVMLGPLTNLALALRLDPTLPERIGRLVVMGGAVTAHGNITPSAEFNVYFDPEAAKIVFEAFPELDLGRVVRATDGATGADLRDLARRAYLASEGRVTTEAVVRAIAAGRFSEDLTTGAYL